MNAMAEGRGASKSLLLTKARYGTYLRFGLLAIVISSYLATILVNIRDERDLILEDIQRISDVITVSAQKHTEAIFEMSVQMLSALRADIIQRGAGARTTQQILDDHFFSPPYLRATLFVDSTGEITSSTFRPVIGNNASGLGFFESHKTSSDRGIFTGDIIVGDITQAPHFFSSIGLSDSDSEFQGVIVAAYELIYLRDLYRQLVPSEHYAIALFNSVEGLIVASDSEIIAGELPRSSQFPVNVPSDGSGASGPFEILSESGISILNTSAEITDSAFFVSTMANVDALLAQHRRSNLFKYMFAALFVLTAIALGVAFEIYVHNRRKAEAEKATLEAELRHAQKMEALGTLAGGLAHDFNNLLSSIIGFGEIAKDQSKGNNRLSRAVNQILIAGRRAESLVDQILTFSRRRESTLRPVKLDQIIDEVVELLKASIHPSINIDVEVREPNCWVTGDESQIDQVLMNLGKNAVQSMKEGGRLSIMLDVIELGEGGATKPIALDKGRYLRIRVSDTGEGIPDAAKDRIFDPFFTTKEPGAGTGLGLSIAHSIVAAHNGAIDVDSQRGVGTTVTVYLPKSEPGIEVSESQEAVSLDGGGRVAMIVDDEEAIVSLMEERLAALGFEPVGFVNSIQALTAYEKAPERFDLVIADYLMPELDGLQLAEAIRRHSPNTPIFLMTGFGSREIILRARRYRIADVLKKPVRTRDLIIRLKASLKERRPQQESAAV